MQKLRARHRNARPEDFDIHGDVKRIKAALAEFSRDIRGKTGAKVSQSIQEAKDQSEKMKLKVSKLVVKKPIKTIGFAMLTGAIIGYFLHR